MTRRDPSDRPRTAAGEHGLNLPEYARWASEPGGGPDLARMHAELQRELARERGPRAWLRSRPTPVRASLAGLVLGALIVATMTLSLRVDYALYPPLRMLLVLAAVAGLIAVNLVLLVWPLQLPAAPGWVAKAAVIGAPVTLLVLYALPPAHTHPRSIAPTEFGALLAGTVRCLVAGSSVGVALFAFLRALDRGSRRLLLAAAGAGLAGNLLLQLHCAMTSPAHLLIGHFGVLAFCFAVAAWLGRRRALDPRA